MTDRVKFKNHRETTVTVLKGSHVVHLQPKEELELSKHLVNAALEAGLAPVEDLKVEAPEVKPKTTRSKAATPKAE